MPSSDLLLVTYGTLMRPFGGPDALDLGDRISLVSSCRFRGILYDLGPFPGAVPGEGRVFGELHRLKDHHVWSVLDRYEGYAEEAEESSLFVRRRIDLEEPSGQTAWVYWYNGETDGYDGVPSGDWCKYRGADSGA